MIRYVDVQEVGPMDSLVGFATINRIFHKLTGVHMLLYTITDWLGFVPVIIVLSFGILGLAQLIKRKNLFLVDYDILVLGGFYIIVLVAYVIFEIFVINYRPILINGYLEASYPSSTTLLVTCVMPTTMIQIKKRISNRKLRDTINVIIIIFSVFMVLGRLVAGVHWFTDIVGGALLSASLVMFYACICNLESDRIVNK